MRFFTVSFLFFALSLLIPSLSLSIGSVSSDDFYIKLPEFTSPPEIDGVLENPLWENGAILEKFTQYEPQEGKAPSEKTIAYIGYDKKNLYFGIRCFDSNPKAVRASLTQRDKVESDDEVTIYLDTFNDKKKAFVFQVNPYGVQSDGIYTEIERRDRGRQMGFQRIDKNWDTFFYSAACIDEEGYTVEIAIPFKSLRFPNRRPQLWGFQMMRTIRRKNEEIYWYPRSRDINGFLIQAGILEIEGMIEGGKSFEVMPVVTGQKEDHQKLHPEAGVNLKYTIASNLTADITYNPDFSQVESDIPQVEVNQRYALYYPEKRPFFLEGKDAFDTPLELVYTRKIIDPQWGMKLTGKTGRITLGFLSIYDLNPTEINITSETGEDEEDEEEEEENPYNSLINVFRLKADLFSESHIGFIFTDKEIGSSWNSLSSNFNRVAGVDGQFKFNNYYIFSFQVLGSQSKVNEEKTGIVPAFTLNFSRRSRHLQLNADYTSLPLEFEAASGFFRRKDIKSMSARVGYVFLPQNEIIVDIRPSFEYRRVYDFHNTLTDEQFNFSAFMSGWRKSHLWANFSSSLERYEGIDFYKKTFRASFSSEPFSWLSGEISFSLGDGIYYSEDPYLGYLTSREIQLTLKPITHVTLFYEYKNDNFYREKGGEEVYVVNILTQRIIFQLSRALSLRLITDFNDYDKKLYNSFLITYHYNPGTVFYLGIEDNQEKDESGIFRKQGRYYFIKFSYWWRI